MDEESYSTSYLTTTEQYNHDAIKFVATTIEHAGLALRSNNIHSPLAINDAVDSANTTLSGEQSFKVKPAPKKSLGLASAGAAKKRGKMLALDMSQVTTGLNANFDEDEPRSCDVAIQSSFADNQCSKVTEFIFVGSENVARKKDLLLEKGITHVVNCSGTTSPNFYEDLFKYKTLKLNDSPKEDVLQLFRDVAEFITNAVENGGRVFIHCQRGVSRGPTIALSYIMWEKGMSYEEAYPLMKKARSVCCPNPGFVFQLLEWEHQCKLVSPSTIRFNGVIEYPSEILTCKSADFRLLSRDKVKCS